MPRLQGRGFLHNVINMIGTEKDKKRQGFPEESHMVMLDGKDAGYIARYLGPGTRIEERMNRKDPPINDVDAVAKKHDIDYFNASQTTDKKQRQNAIVDADKLFIKTITKTKDAPITAALAKKAIELKKWGEASGILPTSVFSGGGKKELMDISKALFPPAHFLRKDGEKRQIGGIAPFLIPILASLAAGGAFELGSFLTKKITGKGLNLKQQMVKLEKMPQAQQIDIIHEFMKESRNI